MSADEKSALRALLAVVDIADSNFPRETSIRVSVTGLEFVNEATVTMPTYVFRALILKAVSDDPAPPNEDHTRI